jgi:hypothetical protein
MRAMFGLVALLVGVAVMFYVFTKNTADTLRVAKPMQEQAQQMSGRGQDGQSASSSFKVEPQQRGSQLDALLVTDVTPGGAADTFYGMKKGDRIIQISSGGSLMKINDASNGDPGMAKDMLIQGSFEASLPIMVMRDGKQLTLPASAAPAAPGVTNTPAPTPTASATESPTPAAPPQQPHNIWEQANQIKDGAGK